MRCTTTPDLNLGFSDASCGLPHDDCEQENPTIMKLSTPLPVSNKLLAALSRAEYQRVAGDLQLVSLEFGEVLYEQGDAIRFVYFPIDSLVSLLTVVDRHLALEVGMVGREGMVGVAFALGIGTSPFRAMVQGAGTALRMKAAPFRRELGANPQLRRKLDLYIHTLMAQIAQTAACNRFHVVEARLARWLLMTRDRVRSNEFRLTQEFLGHMLGVRRVGVTNAALALKKRKLIDYNRGSISIIDTRGLETAACSCYDKVRGAHG